MKNLKTTFLFLCICIFSSQAQDNLLYRDIQQAKSFGEKFELVSAFTTPASRSATLNQRIQDNFVNPQEVYMLKYDKSAAKNLTASITMVIPLGSKNLELELQEIKMDYGIITGDGKIIPRNENIRQYQGIVKDDPFSLVAITFGEDEIIGLVATDEGNFNLALDKQSGDHIFYNDKNMKEKLNFTCTTQSDNFPGYTHEELFQSRTGSPNERYVRLYYETSKRSVITPISLSYTYADFIIRWLYCIGLKTL